MTTEKKKEKSATPEAGDAERFLQLALHEEKILNDRMNVFLVVESLLLLFVSRLTPASEIEIIYAAACFGLLITGLWFLSNYRQKRDMNDAVGELERSWAAFRRLKIKQKSWLRSASLWLTLNLLPAVFVIIWIAILFVFRGSSPTSGF